MKKTLFALAAGALLAGCGVETASTAATAASIKKQEVEQGQQTMQQAQEVDNMIVDDVRNFLFGPPGAGGEHGPAGHHAPRSGARRGREVIAAGADRAADGICRV